MPDLFGLPTPDILAGLLARCPATAGLAAADILPMREKGVAHAHFRLRGRGLVLRVPRPGPAAAAPSSGALAHQAACFARAAPSGATPRLAAVIEPAAELPGGALLVEEIAGRAPRLPAELPAIAEALAGLHRLKVPGVAARPPLIDHSPVGPVAATLAVIERQLPVFARASLPAAARAALEEEIAWARRFAAASAAGGQPIALVGTDTHPGNFLVGADGRAIFVDLEKALYGSPAIDLAHATLYTSTSWDRDVQVRLAPAETAGFYERYLERVGAERAARLRPWLAPCRRLTWLRTMIWCTRWLADDGAPGAGAIDGELLAHIRRRVAVFFDPGTIAALRREWLAGAAG